MALCGNFLYLKMIDNKFFLYTNKVALLALGSMRTISPATTHLKILDGRQLEPQMVKKVLSLLKTDADSLLVTEKSEAL